MDRNYPGRTTAQYDAPSAPPVEPVLSRINEHLCVELNSLADIEKRMVALCDRMFGASPPAAGNKVSELVGNSMVHRLQGSAERLADIRNGIGAELSRLEAL